MNPPLPSYMTLEEAAQAVFIRLGQQWSAQHLLGCAERGEFLIHARLPAACRLVRAVRYKEGCDEVLAEAGGLPTISLAACRGLLLAGVTDFDGQAEFTDLPDWFTGGEPLLGDNGKPMRDVVVTWRLADGETPPEIRLEDCRISASSLEELMAAYAPIPCIEPAHANSAKVGDVGMAPAAPNSGNATAIRCGSNPASVYRAWIAEQAGKLVQRGDKLDTLGERIRLLAEERNYRNQAGDPIARGTVIKWIPRLTTGGREKNGTKPSKLIRPAKSN